MQAHRIRGALAPLAVLVLAGCATMNVRTDYDDLSSVVQLRTYDWADQSADAKSYAGDNGDRYGGGEPAVNSPLVDRRVQKAVEAELTRMGYVKATSGTPDFLVSYQVTSRRYTSTYNSGRYYGFHSRSRHHFGHGHFGGHHYGLGSYYSPTYTRSYVRGTLVLDIIDGRTNELLWRGWARDTMDGDPRPHEVQAYVTEAVRKILERFPPTTGARLTT